MYLNEFAEQIVKVFPATRLSPLEHLPKIPADELEIRCNTLTIIICHVIGPTKSIHIPSKAFGVALLREEDDPLDRFFSYSYDIEFDTYDEMENYVLPVIAEDMTTHSF